MVRKGYTQLNKEQARNHLCALTPTATKFPPKGHWHDLGVAIKLI